MSQENMTTPNKQGQKYRIFQTERQKLKLWAEGKKCLLLFVCFFVSWDEFLDTVGHEKREDKVARLV